MSRVEFFTLSAMHDGENVRLSYGESEIIAWPSEQTYFRYPDDEAAYVAQFVAEKFRELFESSGSSSGGTT